MPASTMRMPRSASAACSATEADGSMVLQSITIVPGRAPSAMPSGPSATASTSGPFGSTVTTMSERSATARGESDALGAEHLERLDGRQVRVKDRQRKAVLSRFLPIPRPIEPSPIRPTRCSGMLASHRRSPSTSFSLFA